MKVKELIEELKKLNPDKEVYIYDPSMEKGLTSVYKLQEDEEGDIVIEPDYSHLY